MKRSFIAGLLALLVLAVIVPVVSASDPIDDQVREIARQIQCPVCQSVSVADSSSELAQQMRGVIREKLEQGQTREQIITYFTDRYGEGILLDPPKRGATLLIWIAPVAGVLAGAVIVVMFLRRRTSPSEPTDQYEPVDPGLAPYQARLAEELADLEGLPQEPGSPIPGVARLEGEASR